MTEMRFTVRLIFHLVLSSLFIGVGCSPLFSQDSSDDHGIPVLVQKILQRGALFPDGSCDADTADACPAYYTYFYPSMVAVYHPDKGHLLYQIARISEVRGQYYFEKETFVPEAVDLYQMSNPYCSSGAPIYDEKYQNRFSRYTLRFDLKGKPIKGDLYRILFTVQECGANDPGASASRRTLDLGSEEAQTLIRKESEFWKDWDGLQNSMKMPNNFKSAPQRIPVSTQRKAFNQLYFE
jgi:hypothetical protein